MDILPDFQLMVHLLTFLSQGRRYESSVEFDLNAWRVTIDGPLPSYRFKKRIIKAKTARMR